MPYTYTSIWGRLNGSIDNTIVKIISIYSGVISPFRRDTCTTSDAHLTPPPHMLRWSRIKKKLKTHDKSTPKPKRHFHFSFTTCDNKCRTSWMKVWASFQVLKTRSNSQRTHTTTISFLSITPVIQPQHLSQMNRMRPRCHYPRQFGPLSNFALQIHFLGTTLMRDWCASHIQAGIMSLGTWKSFFIFNLEETSQYGSGYPPCKPPMPQEAYAHDPSLI